MIMQRASYPSFNAPIHPALKSVPDFRIRALELKIRFQEKAGFLFSDLQHFRNCLVEMVCVSLQI
jgi:hypothetical protein